ncbi:MAG: DUF2065 domain-containing protein [Paracoccaceae bacterium]
MEKLLFALGSVAVFEGFFLAVAPGRIPKVLEMLSKFSNSQLSRVGLIIMAVGVSILMISGI